MSTTQDRLRQAARFTRLDADRELLTEAADEIDRLSGGQQADVTDADIVAVMRDGNNCNYNDEAEHIQFARAILALRPAAVPMTMGQAVMYGSEIYAGIMEDEVREVKNSVLIEFPDREDLAVFLRWHDGITAQAKKEGA